jgi:hypothetical protein
MVERYCIAPTFAEKLKTPHNLFDEHINMDWKKIVVNDRPVIELEPNPMNDWFFLLNANALTNQYWDPRGLAHVDLPTPSLAPFLKPHRDLPP